MSGPRYAIWQFVVSCSPKKTIYAGRITRVLSEEDMAHLEGGLSLTFAGDPWAGKTFYYLLELEHPQFLEPWKHSHQINYAVVDEGSILLSVDPVYYLNELKRTRKDAARFLP